MVCPCKHKCYCTILNIKNGEGVLKVPQEHYETFWNKLNNDEEAPPIFVRGKMKTLLYDKNTNAVYYLGENKKKNKKVRHYLFPN
tara:strand:- start:1972 stop:2226 length:255 start_codon:yes stop_codon:yes gene_type:complete